MATRPFLDPSFLINAARAIALEVAAGHQLFLSPEALPAVDDLVSERLPDLQKLVETERFDFDIWKGHVSHISETVANDFERGNLRRITKREQLIEAVHNLFPIYPYD